MLTVTFHGFDGATHTGRLVVAARWAEPLAGVFHRLWDNGYPIERMQLVDDFGASDDASVLANNTSAFNCRAVTGGSGWSRHSYGTAVDLNPRQNPYVYADGHVMDPAAAPYTNRTSGAPAVIRNGGGVVSAFAAIGWRWGGSFSPERDYQHFDAG
jgi:hypothetical protein